MAPMVKFANVKVVSRDANVKVVSRDGKDIGRGTGATHACTLEGCSGLRVTVRWADGRITHPCTKGMDYNEATQTWHIL